MNGDGRPDLIVANECASPNCANGSVSVLLGNGDGTFQGAVSYGSGGLYAFSVAVGDVNGDGKLDLVVANDCAYNTCANGSVSVLLGNGDGTFQGAVSYGSGGLYAYSVAVADVNGDGKPDLVVANQYADNTYTNGGVSVLLGNGDGTFQAAVSNGSGGQEAYSVAVGDVNGDGKPDLIVANYCVSNSNCSNGSLGVLLGRGDGTFQAAVSYGSGGLDTYSVAVGDVNADGKPDLIVANWCASSNCNGSVGVLLGNGDGTFQAAVSYASGGDGAFSVEVGDVNGDGKPDLVVANASGIGSVGVLLGNGDGTFQTVVSYGSGGRSPISVAMGDVNGDGKPDLVVSNECGSNNNCANGSVAVLLGNGDGTFQAAPAYGSGGQGAQSVAVEDVNGDGKPDLIVASQYADNNYANGSVSVLLGNGDGTFQAAVSYGSGGWNADSVAVGDVNGDGKPDLVVSNECISNNNCANGSVAVLLGNGDGTFQAAPAYGSGGQGAQSVAVEDVNGDGKPDLIVANVCISNNNCANGSVSVLLGNGDGTFKAAVSYGSGGYAALSVAVGDVNGDGKPDLVVANQSGSNNNNNANGVVGVLLGNGDGTFQTAVSYGSGGQIADSVAVGDVNGDGKPDLVVANKCVSNNNCANGVVSVLLGNGDGTFQTAVSSVTPPTSCCIQSLALADFDGDGKLDVASGAGGFLLLGNGDGTFQTPITLGAFGLGIAAGDFHHDGKPDLAVAYGSSFTILRNIAANFHYATTTVVTSSLNPAPGGQPVTFTATVTPAFNAGATTGSVTFYDGANVLATVAIASGQARFTTSLLSLATHSITASYAGDSSYLPSTSPVLLETINSSPTTTALSSLLNPSTFNQSVTFTATVTPSGGGTPMGTITFTDGPNALGVVALSGGQAALTTSSLGAGNHSIVASYSGDSADQASTSTALMQIVQMASTSLTLASNINPSAYNQAVTFTATLTLQYGGSATGTVTFKDGANALGTATVSGNLATITVSNLALGIHSITAVYGGDSNFTGSSSGVVSQDVTKASTTTVVASSLNPAFINQTITLTATVTSQYGGTVNGTVIFKSGSTSLGSATLVNGKANVNASFSTPGNRSITATYVGDVNNTGSKSPALTQVVNKYPSSTTVASNLNPSRFGQTVTFTATVTTGGSPTGTVTFKSGSATLSTVALSGNTASLSTSALAVGTHTITAIYSGDSTFKASTSPGLKQVVNKALTAESLASSQNPSAVGQPVTFTATVSSSAGVPTGTVTFKKGATTLGTATLSGGVATFTTSPLPAGSSTITANYGGAGNYSPSSASVIQVVQ